MPNDLRRPSAPRAMGTNPMLMLQAVVMILALWQLFFFQSTLKWDAIDITLPWRYFSTDALRQGILPLWNPYQHLGFAHGTSPETWYLPGLLAGMIRGYGLYSLNVEYLSHLIIAALGFYHLARTLGISKEGATWGALVFPLSGFFVANAQHMGWIIAGAWTPHVFHSYLKFRQGFDWRYGVYFVLVCFLMVSGGYIAISIINTYVLAIVFSCDLVNRYRRGSYSPSYLWQHLRLILLVLAVSSAILVCFYELKINIDRGVGLSDAASLKGSLYFRHLISMVFPFPTVKGTFDFWQGDQAMINMYVGLPALFLLGLSLCYLKDRFFRFAWIAIAIFLMLALGRELPVRVWFNHLPLFDLFRFPSLFRYYVILIGLLIGGKILTHFLAREPGRLGSLLQKGSLLGALFFLGITISFLFLNLDALDQAIHLNITNVWEASALQAILHSLILTLFFLTLKFKPYRINIYTALMLLTGVDMIVATQLNGRISIFSEGPLTSVQPCVEDLPQGYPLPELEDHIGSNLDRGLHQGYLYRNTNTLYKRIGWDGYTPFQYKDYITLEKSDLFTKANLQPPLYLSLYRPRDSTRNYYESFPDPLLTRKELKVTDFNPNRVDLKSDSEEARLLVYNQNLISGWKGFANGIEMPVVKTDIGLAGFILPEGKQTVNLVYQPGNLINSLMISGVLLLTLLIFGLIAVAHQHPMVSLSVAGAFLFAAFICFKPPNKNLIELQAGRSLINEVDAIKLPESSDCTKGRFLDIADLPRFQQVVDNLKKPFTYYQRDLCTTQSEVFLNYLNDNYTIEDTISAFKYVGYIVRERPVSVNTVFETTQRFEGHVAGWDQAELNTASDQKGNRHQNLTNLSYGATYEVKFDMTTSVDTLEVELDVQYLDQNEIRVICSLDSLGQNIWYASVKPSNKGKDGWQKKAWSFTQNKPFMSGSVLKIYVWNPDQSKCMIDNFHVRGFEKQ